MHYDPMKPEDHAKQYDLWQRLMRRKLQEETHSQERELKAPAPASGDEPKRAA